SPAKWHAQQPKQGLPFEVTLGGGGHRNRHPLDLLDLVEVEFGENRMLPQTERVVTAAVERLVADTTEVAHAGQGDIHQPIETLVHPLAPQSNHHPDGHTFAQLEIRYGHTRACHHRSLPGDLA